MSKAEHHCDVLYTLGVGEEGSYYVRVALSEGLLQSSPKPSNMYFYANHLIVSLMFLFGPEHSFESLVTDSTSRG